MIGRFIKNVLVPEKVGSYYLVPQRVLGFDINKTSIHVTQLLLQGRNIILEKFIDQPLELDPTIPYGDRVTQTIKTVLTRVDRYDALRSSISSSMAIFKELTLPFVDPEKISMVLNYEIEPFLPFPISQTIVDFVITQTNLEQKNSVVLVAAVKKEYVSEHLGYFTHAGISPTAITVDLFDLYGLYKFIPRYAKEPGNNVLIDLGFNVTRIAYIVDGRLTLVRTLSKGILQWAKNVGQVTNISTNEALEKLIRFGLEHNDDPAYNNAIKDSVTSFLHEIKFTLDSFIAQTKTEQRINKIFLLGQGADIAHITSFFNKQLTIDCELFEVNELLKTDFVSLKNENRIPRSAILSLGTALTTPTVEKFNLRKQEFAVEDTSLFYKQLITASSFLLFIFGGLLFHSFWQVSLLKKAAQKFEQETVKTLNQRGLAKGKTMAEASKQAEEKVTQEEAIWFAFSSQTRFSFLKYLQDLSSAIDKEATGLVLKKLIITEQEPRSMVLEGEVPDFDALKILERELKQSNMFISIPSLQSPKFSITLQLKKNGDTI
jgi:type IV pilus assembly protein PilM